MTRSFVGCQIDEVQSHPQKPWMRHDFVALLGTATIACTCACPPLFAQEGRSLLGSGPEFLFTPAPKLSKEEAVKRAKTIVIPKVQLAKIAAPDAIAEVRRITMSIEPKTGVEITMSTGVNLSVGSPAVTLEKENVTLEAVLEEIAKQSGLVLSFDQGRADFLSKEEAADRKVVLTAAQTALLKRADTIILPKFEVKEASLPQVIDQLNAQAKQADPEKRGVPIKLSPASVAAQTKLTMAFEGTSVSNVLDYVINLANLRRKMTDSAVILAQHGEG